jgi:hypothetical protein
MSLARQALALRSIYPDSHIRLSPAELVWRGKVTPSSLSESYSLELKLRQGKQPSVRVDSPALAPDAFGRLPHVWDDGSLCLNTFGQWSERMLLVDTTIAWASEWLFHYEMWKGTGVWLGDGSAGEQPDRQARILHPFNDGTVEGQGDK